MTDGWSVSTKDWSENVSLFMHDLDGRFLIYYRAKMDETLILPEFTLLSSVYIYIYIYIYCSVDYTMGNKRQKEIGSLGFIETL